MKVVELLPRHLFCKFRYKTCLWMALTIIIKENMFRHNSGTVDLKMSARGKPQHMTQK